MKFSLLELGSLVARRLPYTEIDVHRSKYNVVKNCYNYNYYIQ